MTVLELLAKQAAEQRDLSRAYGIEATEMQPDVEGTAVRLVEIRERERDLRRQLDEIHREERKASDEYDELAAAMAAHEAEAQQAADIAESLDRIAAQMRDQRPTPPHEALAATGLMHEPPKVVPRDDNGRVIPPPGEVEIVAPECETCGEPIAPNGNGWHHVLGAADHVARPASEDDSPFTVVRAPDEVIAAVTGALPAGEIVATGPPDMTMPDTGIAPEPLPPAAPADEPRHAKPKGSRRTGGFRIPTFGLVDRDPTIGRLLDQPAETEQDGDRDE